MNAGRLIGRWTPAVIGAYLIGKMAYVFGTGMAQPADIALAALALFIAPPARLVALARELRPLALMLAWVTLVSAGWAAIRMEPEFLAASLYLAFNVLAVAAVIGARERDPERFDRIVIGFLLASIVLQLAAVLILPGHVNKDGVLRAIGTFVKPNQLAYWAVCAMALWLVLRRCRGAPLDVAVLAMLTVVQVMSLSRAGMAATAVGLGLWAWFALKSPRLRIAALALLVAIGAVALSPLVRERLMGWELYAGLQQRLHKQDQHSSLTDRSLQRLIDYPQHLLLGAGEGDHERFTRGGRPLEVHSTFGALLFGYGVVGLGLFLWLLAGIVRTTPPVLWAQLVPPLVFSLAHQGLRFTFFWILVALLLSMGREVSGARSSPAPGR